MAIRKVRIESGVVVGQSAGTSYVSVFRGIPYAAPPTGDLRWRDPQPVTPWEGERPALTFSAMEPQPPKAEGSFYWKEYFPVYEECSEDCLYLNVWTSAVTGEERMPVFVWIHGGAFKEGYGHTMGYDGEAYAAAGVVTVTINYRLGIFGFLADKELSQESAHHSSGNYGFLDQIAALQWVQRNISAFGGDPGQVTIAGQSAGGASVQVLSSSPLTKGLFQRAIIQSGGGLFALYEDPYLTLDEAEALDEVRTVLHVKDIAEARQLSGDELLKRQVNSSFWRRDNLPIVDGYVLTEDINAATYHDHHHRISYLIGSTRDEGIPMYQMDRVEYARRMREILGDRAEEYLALCPMDTEEEFKDFSSQLMQERLRIGTAAWCMLQNKLQRPPAYLYQFTHELPGEDHAGAVHSSEHWYVFRTFLRSWRRMTETDFRLAVNMSSYWINFAKTGDPNGEGLPLWPAFSGPDPEYMELGDIQRAKKLNLNPRERWSAELLQTEGAWKGKHR